MDTKTLNRREFLRIAGLSTAPLALPGWAPRLAFAPPGSAPSGDLLVCVFLRGGMDGLNAVIPHFESEYYGARANLSITEPRAGNDVSSIELDDRFSLHPSLRPLLDPFQAGELAIVHACGSPDPTHSHFDAMDYMERGTPGEKQIASGWIARHLLTAPWENESPFRAIGVGVGLQASLRGPVPATALQSVAEFHLPGNPQGVAVLQQTLSSLYELPERDESLFQELSSQAATTFEAMDLLAGLDPAGYQPSGGADYPEDDFGRGLSQIALLAKSELGLEIACIDIGGWDTHIQQGAEEGRMPQLMASVAGGLAAFHRDMGEKMKDATVVTMSEFGRRVAENGGGGTDHGHGGVMFVMGGGILGGKVYGEWPGLAPDNLYGPGDLAITTDFREVLAEIVLKRLKNNRIDEVFPGYRVGGFLGLANPRNS
ncbi:MAG: DUF1501 domain-containing protein [Chloroflexi bacterium]|nr:DUF1501 domain-containing protein [Chloroflexota bacterium]